MIEPLPVEVIWILGVFLHMVIGMFYSIFKISAKTLA